MEEIRGGKGEGETAHVHKDDGAVQERPFGKLGRASTRVVG